MPHKLLTELETGIISVLFHGEINLDDIKRAAADAWSKRIGDGLHPYLTIFRDATLKLATREILYIHELYEELGINKSMVNAIVIPRNEQLLEDITLHEISSDLRHWKVKVFFDPQAAKEWLLDLVQKHAATPDSPLPSPQA